MQVQKVCQGANTVPNCGVVRGPQVVCWYFRFEGVSRQAGKIFLEKASRTDVRLLLNVAESPDSIETTRRRAGPPREGLHR